MSLDVLHIHSGNIFGGVERLLIDLAAEDHACRHRFALCWPGETASRLEAVATVHPLPAVRLSRPWQVAAARRAARTLLASHPPQRIVTHSDWSTAIFGPVAASARVPLVRWHHGRHGHPVLRFLAARVPVARHVANSAWTAAGLGGDPPVVHPPVRPLPATASRAVTRASAGTGPDPVVVLTTARMEAGKGHGVLLEAFARIRDAEALLWIVGGPQSENEKTYAAAIEEQARALRIVERVRFLGHRNDVGDLLQAADIYCQPSLVPESFGIAIVEALYAGLPVIATAVGGPAEIVTPACGDLVPPGDVAALAAALGTLIPDRDRRARLAAGGPTRAREMSDPRRQIAAFAALLREAGGATFEPQ